MKSITLYLLLAASILLFATNCNKSEDHGEPPTPPDTTIPPVSITLEGQITDKDNAAVSGAQVTAGGVTAATDADGFFKIQNAMVNKDLAFVNVEKTGFFAGSRTFMTTANAVNFVRIKLIPKVPAGGFQSASGVLISGNGSSISVKPNSLVLASTGADYNGQFSISRGLIEPTSADRALRMPGALRGIEKNKKEAGLLPFAMIVAEINGQAGEKLQLAKNKPAEVIFSIPSQLLSAAPASIPMWYYDSAEGIWKEEGRANKQGNTYVGDVDHFSFWACATTFDVITLEAAIKYQDGTPITRADVVVRKVSDSSAGRGITDNLGRIRTMVPKNETLLVQVYNRCNKLIHSQNAGPFLVNSNLGTITTSVAPAGSVTISGTVINCSNAPVTNGTVSVSLEGTNYQSPITNGNFSITISRCDAVAVEARLQATDAGAGQTGAIKSFSVTSGAANIGQLSACAGSNEYFNYTLNGVAYSFSPPTDSCTAAHTNLPPRYVETYIIARSADRVFDCITTDTATVGTFNTKGLGLRHGTVDYFNVGIGQITYTEYGPVGGYVAGNFQGNLFENAQGNVYMTCTFRVKRIK